MFKRPLQSFVPTVYRGVVEMEDLVDSEEQIMSIARSELTTAFANTFILTSDETGVIMFEKMLGIVANTHTEDLEFRRARVLNRLSTRIPFTFRFLKQKLNEIIGVNAWTASIDFENHTLYIQSSAVDQNWYSELEFTINRMKPCNMVFINVPYTPSGVSLSEEISYGFPQWKYRLGNWKLGEHPFSILQEGGVVKMRELKSIESALLNDTAQFVADDVAYVLLNDAVRVSEFRSKRVSAGVATIEYEVTPRMLDVITGIKLMKADGSVLTQSAVYVPVTQAVYSKHTITVKEGV